MPSEDESSWRLLFGIALSHGELLRAGRLSHDGWMVFLSSAQLIGPATGVFPVLLDQLWQRQSLSEGARQAGVNEHDPGPASVSSRAFSLSVGSSRMSLISRDFQRSGNITTAPSSSMPRPSSAAHEGESIGFSGFVDMMKVICVRIFQTQRFTRLREGHGNFDEGEGESALRALRESAEDHVLLTESVKYTAATFLRPFISRCVIHASSQMRLHPARNGWALHVNRLVAHVVGALLHTAILPLFRKYAVAGRLSEAGYRAFIRDAFPVLDAVKETCAVAIFYHGGFPDIRPLVKGLQPLAASVSPELATVVSEPTLGFTDFIEAMLMLTVVVYSDEVRYPAQRPITAKVWSFFEEHVCGRALRGAAMCSDPYVTGRYATVPPGLVAVYPAVAPRLQCPCLFVEVINFQGDNVTGGAVQPPAAQASNKGPPSSLFLTEVTVAETELSLCSPWDCGANSDVALQAAATFFATEWSLLERNRCVPLFGRSRASVSHAIMICGAAVEAAPTRCPEILQVPLPDSLQQPTLYQCAVEAAAATAVDGVFEEGAVCILFTPFRSLTVELAVSDDDAATRDKDGESATQTGSWGCADVIATDTPLVQVVPPRLLAPLHTLFVSQTPARSGDDPAASAQPRISLSAVCELCRQLQWCATSYKQQHDLPSLCAQAWTKYGDFQRILHSTVSRHGNTSSVGGALSSFTEQAALLSFTDLIGCLATVLFLEQGGRLSDVPDVPRRLEFALSSFPSTFTSATGTASRVPDAGLRSPDIYSIPYNAFRDVPYLTALERKRKQSKEAQERRTALIASLREHHALQIPTPVTLPPLPEDRPCAMRLVSQYGAANPTTVFHAVMRDGAEAIKAHFLQQELAIPEMPE
ncbi:conserved hypothetical protein [Leishmania infantum JPCM5]|uniref:Uncharacterized protein n=2 Tax=Leishmania infantum TaxID=5671 RepID=A4IAC4_LEIIN|nr:conserved hypothetical protein [Leishmania infantum JPCM5]CAC9540851.1 hypothetical_protein_-_conserved [Leishmania infantum]CAM71781.1 conserved hypothetical protein [Leishmania infantum JPCM5]SUZ45736.1 hypothetical_protein_-_conserved [Leishmania infantum]|eukprot:XP_001468693.1 conserved hypothetical protein [Leishmania infantum JPCM5]